MNWDEIATVALELAAVMVPCFAIIFVGSIVGGLHLAVRKVLLALAERERRDLALRLAHPQLASGLRRHRSF
jgi:hypothetical protein